MERKKTWDSLRDFIITVFLACSIFEQVAYMTTGIRCTRKTDRAKAYPELGIDGNTAELWERLYKVYNSIKHIPKEPIGEEPDLGPWYKVDRFKVIKSAYFLLLDLFARAANCRKCPGYYKEHWSKLYHFLTLDIIYYQSFYSKTNELIILFRTIVFSVLPELREELEKGAGLA